MHRVTVKRRNHRLEVHIPSGGTKSDPSRVEFFQILRKNGGVAVEQIHFDEDASDHLFAVYCAKGNHGTRPKAGLFGLDICTIGSVVSPMLSQAVVQGPTSECKDTAAPPCYAWNLGALKPTHESQVTPLWHCEPEQLFPNRTQNEFHCIFSYGGAGRTRFIASCGQKDGVTVDSEESQRAAQSPPMQLMEFSDNFYV